MATLVAFTAFVGVASARGASNRSVLPKTPIFGRWQQTHRCTSLVHALKEAHLGRIAPAMVGDYFPDKTPQELAAKEHICWGAKPQRHSHFFTRDGHFGSVDQYGQQVDNGRYRVINARTFRIGDVKFHYDVDRVFDRKVLALKPVITRRMRRQALADPLQFSDAGWSVAVT